MSLYPPESRSFEAIHREKPPKCAECGSRRVVTCNYVAANMPHWNCEKCGECFGAREAR